jgi:hypothetical protein
MHGPDFLVAQGEVDLRGAYLPLQPMHRMFFFKKYHLYKAKFPKAALFSKFAEQVE